MAQIFGILTVLTLLFTAFVAHKNKGELEETKAVIGTEQSNFQRNQATFEKTVDEIDVLKEETAAAIGSRDKAEEAFVKQEEENAQRVEERKQAEQDREEVLASVEIKEESLVELGKLEGLAPQIRRLIPSISELEDEFAILTATNSRLSSEKTKTTATAQTLSTELSNLTSGRSLEGMKTTIRSVSPLLGFVTLSGGMDSGVVGSSKVDVKRGGETIAQMIVSAVTRNTATADLIQGTLGEGVQVAAGDIVVPAEED